MTLVARHGALSDIGLHRKTNEDAFEVQPPLYVVCDGMGGASAGEVASGLAVETLVARTTAGDSLLEAAEAANAAVFQRASANPEQAGMGTTLTAFLLEGSAAHFVHIGDSRAYLLRDGGLEQLSDDHSLVGEMVRDGRLTVDEAAADPHRSILSRALGTEARAKIDEFPSTCCPATSCSSAATNGSAARSRTTTCVWRSPAGTPRRLPGGWSWRPVGRAAPTTSPPSSCASTRPWAPATRRSRSSRPPRTTTTRRSCRSSRGGCGRRPGGRGGARR